MPWEVAAVFLMTQSRTGHKRRRFGSRSLAGAGSAASPMRRRQLNAMEARPASGRWWPCDRWGGCSMPMSRSSVRCRTAHWRHGRGRGPRTHRRRTADSATNSPVRHPARIHLCLLFQLSPGNSDGKLHKKKSRFSGLSASCGTPPPGLHYAPFPWRDAGVAERGGLENR